MSKKKKKNKQAMNPRTKESLVLGFRSIISNDACVELGRTRPWYGALIAGILSSIIVVIPTLVSGLKVQGSDILDTPTYGIENGLVHFQQDVKESGLDLTFDVADKILSVNQDTWNTFAVSEHGAGSTDEPWYHHYNETTGFLDFQVYYTTLTGESLNSFAYAVYSGANPMGGTAVTYANDKATDTTKIPTKTSSLILAPEEFRIFKYNANSVLAFGGTITNWQYATALPLNDLIKNAPSAGADADTVENYRLTTIESWTPFLDKAYARQRNINAWRSTGIMWAIYSVFISLMGAMVWFMTRGKNNPFRVIQFWEAQKIAYWASPTPAVIALVFGFVMGSSGGIMQFLFIFVGGMRIMWMSMRSLKPAQ